jgi:hypothetical protein
MGLSCVCLIFHFLALSLSLSLSPWLLLQKLGLFLVSFVSLAITCESQHHGTRRIILHEQ